MELGFMVPVVQGPVLGELEESRQDRKNGTTFVYRRSWSYPRGQRDQGASEALHLSPSIWSQTMNYVGQLAETVLVTVKELYKGLNPATLTGCIDVLVVRQPDGSYRCSPFHVRFGKLGVLRSKEKVVDIEINGEPVDLHMKLGDNGEAFFVQETETSEETVPSHLSTSPLPLEDLEYVDLAATSTQDLTTSQLSPIKEPEVTDSDTSLRKKKRRRKKIKPKESPKKEDMEQSLEDKMEDELSLDDKYRLLASSNSIYYSFTDVTTQEPSSSLSKDFYPYSDGEYTPPVQSCSLYRPSSPKTDSELEIKSPDVYPGRTESHMRWSWGRLPEVSKSERTEPSKSARSSPSTYYPLLTPKDDSDLAIQPCETTHFRAIAEDWLDDVENLFSKDSSHSTPLLRPEPLFLCRTGSSMQESASHTETVHAWDRTYGPEAEQTIVEEQRLQKSLAATRGEKSETAKEEEFKLILHLEEMPGTSLIDSESMKPARCDTSTDLTPYNQSKKGSLKRSQHLGPSDIYLDDLIKLNSEEISLYFPKSDSAPASKPCTDASTYSHTHLLRSTMSDSGMECFSDPSCELVDNVMLSLCGGLGDSREIQNERFMQHVLSYNTLAENPAVLDDPNLVVRINNKYYNWAAAAPMILSLQAFQKNLPKSTIDKLVKEKMPKKSGRWWFSWRRKDFPIDENGAREEKDEADQQNILSQRKKEQSTSSEEESENQEGLPTAHSVPQNTPESIFFPLYKKSLRLSSEQISRLNLKDGVNDAAFSVTTQYQGTCRCEATIYLWNWDDKIVISDIDGTITKSDALGHILPHLGKDWTHRGIAKLYHKIHMNGYKILYCSARAIGMSELTKGYLQWVNDRGCELPKGPVLLAPSSLFSALHREVIEKKPEVFKIACLTDIKNLFGSQQQPFYAAFGNKKNDVYAYKEVGLPESRIFTVNPKGEVIQELTKTKSSYTKLSELVELIFPSIAQTSTTSLLCPEFSNFPFWRDPIGRVSLEEVVDML